MTRYFELSDVADDILAIENPQSYGGMIGKTILDTCIWIGRFIQVYFFTPFYKENNLLLIKRPTVKSYLCSSVRAKDKNVTEAVKDYFLRYEKNGRDGKNNLNVKGTKKHPGQLYEFKKDLWQALAVCLTAEQMLIESGRCGK